MTKGVPCPAASMGALYEDVEKFFGDIFAWYGRIVARYPLPFVLTSMLICGLLGLGLLKSEYYSDFEELYSPLESEALKHQLRLQDLFLNGSSDDFREYQSIYRGYFASLIIRIFHPEELSFHVENGTDEDFLKRRLNELDELVNYGRNVNVHNGYRSYGYRDVCRTRRNECMVTGMEEAQSLRDCLKGDRPSVTHSMKWDNASNFTVLEMTNFSCRIANMSGVYHIKYHLVQNKSLRRENLQWQKQFLTDMSHYNASTIAFVYTVSDYMELEQSSETFKDVPLFGATVAITVIYATVVGFGGNWVSTNILIAQASIVATLMALLGAFGLLSFLGIPFVDICGVVPFIIVGIGIDDMFLLLSAWRRSQVKDKQKIEDRMAETFRQSALSITITSLTNVVAFCTGATSPFLAIKYFCAYSGVAIFLCYVNNVTFFSGCLALHARRVAASRHCITCLVTKSRSAAKTAGDGRIRLMICSGEPSKTSEESSLKWPIHRYAQYILWPPVKAIVLAVFLAYLILCVWGASKLEMGLERERLEPNLYNHLEYKQWRQRYLPQEGVRIMVAITEPVKYFDDSVHVTYLRMLSDMKNSEMMDNTWEKCWLSEYLKFVKTNELQLSPSTFISNLATEFLPQYPEYKNDVQLRVDGAAILASRCYVRSKFQTKSGDDAKLILNIRTIASNSSLPVIAFSPTFLYSEHHLSILKNTLLAVGVTITGMLFIALMFIPHPIAITCVILSMISNVIGMFGFCYFWGLPLSPIETIQIIIGVGLCLNFTTHISHAFMVTLGGNRTTRVRDAMITVGGTLLSGAISIFLGILLLVFGKSYIFQSFFKTMLSVVILGLIHAVFFLPVLLTFVGPRRTIKPRMFIPVSPSSRSITSAYSGCTITSYTSNSKSSVKKEYDNNRDSSERHSEPSADPGVTPGSSGVIGSGAETLPHRTPRITIQEPNSDESGPLRSADSDPTSDRESRFTLMYPIRYAISNPEMNSDSVTAEQIADIHAVHVDLAHGNQHNKRNDAPAFTWDI